MVKFSKKYIHIMSVVDSNKLAIIMWTDYNNPHPHLMHKDNVQIQEEKPNKIQNQHMQTCDHKFGKTTSW